MSRVLKGCFQAVLIIATIMAMMIAPVYANLVATTFGFPVIVQNGSTSAFNQDTAFATDLENIDINFPAFSPANDVYAGPVEGPAFNGAIGAGGSWNVLPFGPVNLAFPSISQTVEQTQNVTHTDFAQTNEYAEFAYPFVGVGPVSLPGFGFGF